MVLGRQGITSEFLDRVRNGDAAFSEAQVKHFNDHIGGFITRLKEDSRKYIYLARHGNFSTLVHEVSHSVREVLPAEMLRQAEEDSRKYIYLARHGNFSTLVHEVSHSVIVLGSSPRSEAADKA